MAFVPMRGERGTIGVIGMGRGPGRPAYTSPRRWRRRSGSPGMSPSTSTARPGSLLPLLLIDGAIGSSGQAERRFPTLVERVPAMVYEAEPGADGRWRYVSALVETLLGYTPDDGRPTPSCGRAPAPGGPRDGAGRRAAPDRRRARLDGVPDARPRRQRRVGARRDPPGNDEEGRVLVEGILSDISERKRGRTACSTSPTTTRSPACSTAAASSRSSTSSSPRPAAGCAQRRDRARHRRLQDRQRLVRPPGRRRADPDVARMLGGRLRSSDAVARLGGDEFASCCAARPRRSRRRSRPSCSPRCAGTSSRSAASRHR